MLENWPEGLEILSAEGEFQTPCIALKILKIL